MLRYAGSGKDNNLIYTKTIFGGEVWTKPSYILPTDTIKVRLWGAGGGGAGAYYAAGYFSVGTGGSGGGYAEFDGKVGDIQATSITVRGGIGGTGWDQNDGLVSSTSGTSVPYNTGGSSFFGLIQVTGGAAGSYANSAYPVLGGIGIGGTPQLGGSQLSTFNSTTYYDRLWGKTGAITDGPPMWQGGLSINTSTVNWWSGSSVKGGGAGGSGMWTKYLTNNYSYYEHTISYDQIYNDQPGMVMFGGKGGRAGYPKGEDGYFPGGGGGAGLYHATNYTTIYTQGGNGADGCVKIEIWRGS